MKAYVVIGAGLGDEGKGLYTDYLANRTTNAVVVRANGGAQAAHTTQIDGYRTIFHHFGSGHYAGAITYFGLEFIVNPILFMKEYNELLTAEAFCHPNCRVSTPYDMMYNQVLEIDRGSEKHGSCGVGINATVDRDKVVSLEAHHLNKPSAIFKALDQTYEYVRSKLKNTEMFDRFVGDREQLEARFVGECMFFHSKVPLVYGHFFKGRDIIFEMAQGLLLDEHHEWFPYVTRSRTGLDNVIAMLPSMPHITELEVIYMTRAYATRHGAGPFPTEVDGMYYKDKTNGKNRWQGRLRYGNLDIDRLMDETHKDFTKLGGIIRASKTLCVTCMDQMNSRISYVHKGELKYKIIKNDFLQVMADAWGAKLMYSNGPERTNVHKF